MIISYLPCIYKHIVCLHAMVFAGKYHVIKGILLEVQLSMNIVYINTVKNTGSTGRITSDLANIATQNGFTTYIAYGRGELPASPFEYRIGNKADFLHHVFTNFTTGRNAFASRSVTKRFLNWLDTIKPDIIHLHNIHGFYIHAGMLFEYIKQHNIPVVWTLHDCWPFTGHCAHFDYISCNRWESGCHNCSIYRSAYPYSIFKDNSKENFALKKEAFTNVNQMTIVTPSHWLGNLVKSSFLKDYPVEVIHNGINLDVFKPLEARTDSSNRKNILGVANVWTHRKGLSAFLQLADMLDDSYHITLVGLSKSQQKKISSDYPHKVTALQRTASLDELMALYSNAFAFVNPTLEDNFPTTNLEAIACGTPVITYRTGGSPESLDDTCGIVVDKDNVQALHDAILSLNNNSNITRQSCREHAMQYDKNSCFKEYIELYNTILSDKLP